MTSLSIALKVSIVCLCRIRGELCGLTIVTYGRLWRDFLVLVRIGKFLRKCPKQIYGCFIIRLLRSSIVLTCLGSLFVGSLRVGWDLLGYGFGLVDLGILYDDVWPQAVSNYLGSLSTGCFFYRKLCVRIFLSALAWLRRN